MKNIPNKTKLVLFTLVIVGILSFLIYDNFQQSAAYYIHVKELLEESPASDKYLRVSGLLLPETIAWNGEEEVLTFEIQDTTSAERLPVKYHKIKPENLEENEGLLLEGYYQGDHLQVEKIMFQCPSKYEEEIE